MSNPYISRFKKHFPAYVYTNIAACLKMNQGIGATILICCAIDTLASYASANPSVRNNKARFIDFVSKYFPTNYDPEQFYKFVRCGLVHSFNMENQYYLLCSNKPSAQELHLTKPKGYHRKIVNPYSLFRHLKRAHKKFVEDLENDINLKKVFSRAGAFTYTPPATDFPAYIESVKNLVMKPADQGNRFLEYLQSDKEVLLYDCHHKEIGKISRDDFEHVTICAVTLDPFTELAAQVQHLKQIGIDVGTQPIWSISIDDLRVYADIFDMIICSRRLLIISPGILNFQKLLCKVKSLALLFSSGSLDYDTSDTSTFISYPNLRQSW